VCLGGAKQIYTATPIVYDGNGASASSGVPLSETPTPRETTSPAANHEYKLIGRKLLAHHLQRGRQLQRSDPSANSLELSLQVCRELAVCLVSTSPPHLPCLVQEGEVIACLCGKSNAYTAAQVVGGGYGSFVIKGAGNTACRCSTPSQPLTHRNQLNSCLFVHLYLKCQNSDGFLGMAKRHQALI
jgi:hypothetical protein